MHVSRKFVVGFTLVTWQCLNHGLPGSQPTRKSLTEVFPFLFHNSSIRDKFRIFIRIFRHGFLLQPILPLLRSHRFSLLLIVLAT